MRVYFKEAIHVSFSKEGIKSFDLELNPMETIDRSWIWKSEFGGVSAILLSQKSWNSLSDWTLGFIGKSQLSKNGFLDSFNFELDTNPGI